GNGAQKGALPGHICPGNNKKLFIINYEVIIYTLFGIQQWVRQIFCVYYMLLWVNVRVHIIGMVKCKIPQGIIGIYEFYNFKPVIYVLMILHDPLFQFIRLPEIPEHEPVKKKAYQEIIPLFQRIYRFGEF